MGDKDDRIFFGKSEIMSLDDCSGEMKPIGATSTVLCLEAEEEPTSIPQKNSYVSDLKMKAVSYTHLRAHET